MWQRTQVIVRIKQNNSQEPATFALHNQRWFGRPLVSSTLNIARAVLEEYKNWYTHIINKKRVEAHASMVNDEYFWHHVYDCNFPYEDEHDNDNWYSEIDIDTTTKTISRVFYTADWVETEALEYIKSLGCEDFCHTDWKIWYLKTTETINNFLVSNDRDDD